MKNYQIQTFFPFFMFTQIYSNYFNLMIIFRYCEVESYDLGKENVRIAAGAGATKLRKEGKKKF